MFCLLYNLSQIKSTVQQSRPECSQTNVCNHGLDYGRTVEDRIRAYVCCVCKQPHPLSAIYTAFTGITRVDICTECFTNLSECDKSKCIFQNCQKNLLDAKKSHRLQHVETKPQAQNQINLVNNCSKTQGELRTKLPEMHGKCFDDPRLCTKVDDAKTISLRDLLLKRSAYSLFPGQKRCISSRESQSLNLKRKSIQKDDLMPKKSGKADSMFLEEPNSDREQDAPILSLAKFAAKTAHSIDKSLASEIGVKHSSDESNSAFLDHNESFIQFEQYFAHLQNYSDRHFLIPYKEDDLRKLYRDLAVLGKWPNKRVNPPKIIPKNLFEIGNIDEDKISAHFLEISDEEANILKENCMGTDRRKIDKILDKATRTESTSLPRYQTKKRKSPGKVQRKYIPEDFDALEIVTELIRFFCVDGDKSRACILKLEILKLLPNFYELPLFLDHIKFASFDGIQTKLVRKLKVLLSFALNIRKYIRHNTAKQTYIFSGCSMAEFIAISRHQILRYLKLEGRKRRSFVFYSHAMAMKHKTGLTEKENASLDIILYSAFIIRSIDKVYGFPVSVYVSGRNSFVALTANSSEFTFADLLSINHFSPFGIFSATLLIRIIRYITECRISCNLPGVNYDNWYFLRLERNIAVIKKNDGAIKKYDIQFYNPEAIVKDCIGRYMAIVEQGVHFINTLPNKE